MNNEDSRQSVWMHEALVPLNGPTEIATRKTIVQDIFADNSHEYRAKTYVDSIKVEIVYPYESLGLEFHAHGLAFEKYGIDRDGVAKMECKDLIFGHQGYKFTFRKH